MQRSANSTGYKRKAMRLFLLCFIFSFCSSLIYGQSEQVYKLHFSSFLGGADFEQSRNIAVDNQGNIYVSGGTSSSDFPTTPGVYQEDYDDRGSSTIGNWGPMSVFVSKFSPDGELLWSTFIGGPSYDRAYAIEVADNGLIYIGGRAGEGYPTTPGAYQRAFATDGARNGLYGHQNGFVSILSNDGKELLYSTYYGADAHGFFRDIDIDDQGHVYGVLNAARRAAPGIKPDAFDTRHNGGEFDMAAVKFTPTLDSVIWATMLGGSGKDRGGPSIRVGTDYSVFVAGGTESRDFPVTPGAVQTQFGGGRTDMFVARIEPNGTDLIYCTYFGGNDFDVTETHGLWVDDHNQAHVACGTKSTDIQTTPGAIKATKPGDDLDALLFKLSSDGTELMACSYYGGSGNDYSEGLFTAADGDLYFGGSTYSDDLMVTAKAYQTSFVGDKDAFLARVDSSFSELKYSSYFGGSGMDAIRAFAEGPDGTIVFGGQTQSSDLPTTPGAFQEQRPENNDRADCFVAALTPDQMTAAADLENNSFIAPWPNPTDSYLNFEGGHEKRQLSIHRPTGILLYQSGFTNTEMNIDVSNYASGLYFYSIHDENGKKKSGKFVKR